jgi:hypothetical protein
VITPEKVKELRRATRDELRKTHDKYLDQGKKLHFTDIAIAEAYYEMAHAALMELGVREERQRIREEASEGIRKQRISDGMRRHWLIKKELPLDDLFVVDEDGYLSDYSRLIDDNLSYDVLGGF